MFIERKSCTVQYSTREMKTHLICYLPEDNAMLPLPVVTLSKLFWIWWAVRLQFELV